MAAVEATPPDDVVVSDDHQSTNALDMDIAAIEDPELRRRIATAFERLRGRAEYGLVFDKHKPESVVLHGQPIREDRYATLRAAPGPKNAFRVVAMDGDKATLQPVDEHFRAAGGNVTEALDRLVPLARFGDPIFPGMARTGEVLGAVDGEGNPTKPFHTVINGENFHALELDPSRNVIGWYRNPDSGRAALSVPYYKGSGAKRQLKLMHPDFIFVRDIDGELVVDIIDPTPRPR